jgi:hypothetical protein
MVIICERSSFTHLVTLLLFPMIHHAILNGVDLLNRYCPSGAMKGKLLAIMEWWAVLCRSLANSLC